MPGPEPLTHDPAGRVEPKRLGIRFAEATAGAPGTALEGAFDETRLGPFEVRLRWEVARGEARACARVCNAGPSVVHLDSVVVGLHWTDHGLASLRFLRHGRDSDAVSSVVDLEGRDSEAASALVAVVGAARGGPTCVAGVAEQGLSFGNVYARCHGSAVALALEQRVEGCLAPGEERDLEPLFVALGTDASALLERFGERYGGEAGARVSRPFTSGWRLVLDAGGEERLRRELDALAALRDEIPIEVVLLDNGYQRAVGDWVATHEGLPHGLPPLAAEIRSAGFTPGLWTAPFCVVAASEIYDKHRDWLLQRGGAPLVALQRSDWSPDGSVYVLDASRRDVTAHLARVHRELVDMGFFHLELGELHAAALGERDRSVGGAERLRRGLEAVRAGAGEEAFVTGAGGPVGAATGVVDAMCLGSDPDCAAPRAWMHRRLWLNALENLPARGGGRLATLAAATGTSTFFSGDPTALDEGDRAPLRATLEGARAVDAIGIPGAARVPQLLAEDVPGILATDDGEALLVARVGAGEATGIERLAHSVALAVFCDFDGTFSVQDVGATLAQRHAGGQRPVAWERYERGEITAWQYNLEILDGLPISAAALDAFLHTVELDPGARDLLAWCQARRVPFRILSDGFDWNLNRLQAIHGVRFAATANQLRIQRGRWRIRAGGPDPDCRCGTGVCKGRVLRRFRSEHPDAFLAYVGNGRVSDTCGALAADRAFAKDSLAIELTGRGVPFEPFDTLRDVVAGLERLVAQMS